LIEANAVLREEAHYPSELKGSHQSFQFRGVRFLKPSHPALKALKGNTSQVSVLGERLWPSSFLLIDYLSSLSLDHSLRFLELGCGWGSASAYLNKQHGVEVTAVDGDKNVFPFLHLTRDLNNCDFKTHHRSYKELQDDFPSTDVMIGADICYSQALNEDIYALSEHAFQQDLSELILADQGRPAFMDLCERLEKLPGVDVQLHSRKIKTPNNFTGYILHLRKH